MSFKIPVLPLHSRDVASHNIERKDRLSGPQLDGEGRAPSTELLNASVGGDGRTPRSIIITAGENNLLRIPDSALMFKQQASLQEMLADIHEDPNGFEDFIHDIRSEMKPHTDIASPFDSRCGSLQDYELDESAVVGRGRFSVVYFATRKGDNAQVAMKKISFSNAHATLEMVSPIKEVGLLRSLEHPNVVRYLDSFLHERELWIVLEWAGKVRRVFF